MRPHPVAGVLFLVLAAALFVAGALGSWAPSNLPTPIPPAVVIPLALWQLGVWALLFGLFFLRPRTAHAPRGRAPHAR